MHSASIVPLFCDHSLVHSETQREKDQQQSSFQEMQIGLLQKRKLRAQVPVTVQGKRENCQVSSKFHLSLAHQCGLKHILSPHGRKQDRSFYGVNTSFHFYSAIQLN